MNCPQQMCFRMEIQHGKQKQDFSDSCEVGAGNEIADLTNSRSHSSRKQQIFANKCTLELRMTQAESGSPMHVLERCKQTSRQTSKVRFIKARRQTKNNLNEKPFRR